MNAKCLPRIAIVISVALIALLSTAPAADPVKKEKDKYDEAVDAGLEWLALHQAPTGHWSLDAFPRSGRTKLLPAGALRPCNCTGTASTPHDVAGAAFGVLSFLAAGHTHKAGPKAGPYTKVVSSGLGCLMQRQGRDGYFGDMYSHALATLALCEAYALTSDPKLKVSAQKALKLIVDAQDPGGGGWRYAPRQPGDLSVTGWQLLALESGRLAKLATADKTVEMAGKFVESCAGTDKGAFVYVPGGAGTTPTLVGEGLWCRLNLGAKPADEGSQAGATLLKKSPVGKKPHHYYEFFASLAMHRMGGEDRKDWFDGDNGVRDVLRGRQDTGDDALHKHQKGSWPAAGDPQSSSGGRVMNTALAILILRMDEPTLLIFKGSTD